MSRLWRTVIVVLAVAVAVVIGARLLFRPRPIEVQVAHVGQGTVEDIVTNSEGGTIESRARAKLGAERAGRVAAILFEEGDRARTGDVVVQLDTSTEQTQLAVARREAQAAEATSRSARADETLARSNWDRVARLYAEKLVTDQQQDEARARLESAESLMRAAAARAQQERESVRLALEEIAHRAVRAPFPGVIARHLVEIGEPVIPGQPVVELIATERLFASAPMDERDAGSLREGLPARVTLDAYPGTVWPARVTRVAPMVEELKEQNRTLGIEAVLDSMASRPTVRPGMTADIEVILRRKDDVLRVPASAVLEGGRVLVAEKGRAHARKIESGLRNWEWVEVRSGLAAGDPVIISVDRPGLKDGARIRVAPAPAGLALSSAR
jgi:HlyD family secretion protein